jgi:peptidoglycan/LPS O-acetylase OafA/YrhL
MQSATDSQSPVVSVSAAVSEPLNEQDAPSAPVWSARIPALDGLRGVAILLVLLSHSVFGLESSSPLVNHLVAVGRLSWSGVDLFFVLSGFLIGGILLDVRASPRYYSTFYARRGYRILPVYFLLTGLFLVRHLPLRVLPGMLGTTSPLSIPWYSYFTFTQSFFMIHHGWYGAPALAVTWSLAVEEQFYLIAPWVMRFTRGSRLLAILALTIVAAPFLRLLIRHAISHGDFACYVLMPCRADALCLGVLSAYLVRRPRFWRLLVLRRFFLWTAAGILLAALAFMTYQNYGQFSQPMTTWGYSVLALFYGCCLLIAVSSSAGLWHRLLCMPWLIGPGTLSYCTYLLHFPLIQGGRRVFYALIPGHSETAYLMGAISAVIVTLILAMLSWRYFEKPMLRRGHKYQYFESRETMIRARYGAANAA